MSSGRLLATNGKIHTPLSVALQEAQGWFQSYYAADS